MASTSLQQKDLVVGQTYAVRSTTLFYPSRSIFPDGTFFHFTYLGGDKVRIVNPSPEAEHRGWNAGNTQIVPIRSNFIITLLHPSILILEEDEEGSLIPLNLNAKG